MTDQKTSQTDFSDEEFDALLAAFLDDELDDEPFERFQALLKDYPEARKRYLELTVLRSSLLEKSVALDLNQPIYDEAREEDEAESLGPLETERLAFQLNEFARKASSPNAQDRKYAGTNWRLSWWFSAAAILFLITMLVDRIMPPAETGPRVRMVQFASEQDQKFWQEGQYLKEGERYHLNQGHVRIELANAVSMAVKGPASFQIQNGKQVKLDQGQVTAYVPETGQGFEIITPNLDVLDQGTSFGVTVTKDGNTSLSVFDGEVVVTQDLPLQSGSSYLSAGQSLACKPQEKLIKTLYDRTSYIDLLNCQFGLVSGEALMLFGENSIEAAERSDHRVLIMPEKQHVKLVNPIQLDVSRPSQIKLRGDLSPKQLNAGRVISSYFVKYKPLRENQNFKTSLTFDRPIEGIILLEDSLVQSDDQLSKVYILTDKFRGLDIKSEGERGSKDTLSFSDDMKTVHISIQNWRYDDSFRLILAEDTR